MEYDTLAREARGLPEAQLAQVIEYIRFLKYEMARESGQHTGNSDEVEKRIPRRLGLLKGGLHYMADDFDETPDCFQEYV